MTSLHEANADAAQDKLEKYFEDWKKYANLDEVFVSLEQTRKELRTENGRIALMSRLGDSYESWIEEQREAEKLRRDK